MDTIKKILLIMWNEKTTSPLRIFKKSYARYRKHGKAGMLQRLNIEYYKIYTFNHQKFDQKKLYQEWIKKNENNILSVEPLKYTPLFSIVTPTYNTKKNYLIKMLESVLAQTYKNWELCIADDASHNLETLKVLKEYEVNHQNIKITYREKNGHISEASNSALTLSTGEYILFLDHDDTLAPNALYEMAKKLNHHQDLKLIYSDEDKIDCNDNRYSPHFKSSWNPDMFFSQNYLCHLVCIKKDIIDMIGGFRVGYEGSQDYDLLLRTIAMIKSDEIDKIDKILYHWRAVKGSTAYGSDEKAYSHKNGLNALIDYFANINPKVKVESGFLPNTYKVNYPIPKNEPLVSILIPTKNSYHLIYPCIQSILEKTHYKNYEILLLNNKTTCTKTLHYFEKIKLHKHIKILDYNKAFNYSAINNFGVQHAKGSLILLLNNDTKIINTHWLNEMVSHAIREEVGAVGAKLYYENETVQHAGVILGIGGVAGHSHKYFPKNEHGYFSRLKIIQNYSAITGACLMVRKEIFEKVEGLNETDLAIAFNDVDLCLKIEALGYRNIWTPYTELYHYESISRGKEDTQEKMNRFSKERDYMINRWDYQLKNDCYYNKNLTKSYENFMLNSDN